MALLTASVMRLRRAGYLILDEVIVAKNRAKRLPWAARISACAKRRTVWGVQIVVLLWCAHDRRWRIPLGFRRWRPKRSGRADRYRTMMHLAEELVLAAVAADYLVFDTQYTASWLTKRLRRLGLTWQGTGDPTNAHRLARTHAIGAGVGTPPASAMAVASGPAGNRAAGLRAELWPPPVGRAQQPLRELGVSGHACGRR